MLQSSSVLNRFPRPFPLHCFFVKEISECLILAVMKHSFVFVVFESMTYILCLSAGVHCFYFLPELFKTISQTL